MRKEQIIDSLGRMDEEVIWKVSKARSGKKPGVALRRWLSVAACCAMILSIVLTAEAASGSVSNLLAPLFGGAQTMIVDEIGVPIGASASVNGYTLTADAIIGDRYSVIVAYTLTREDGQPIPEDIRFLDHGGGLGGSGSRVISSIRRDADDPSTAHFNERWRRNVPLLGKLISSSFSTLAIDNDDGEAAVIAEGTWELTYTLRYPDSTEALPVRDFSVTDEGGHDYKVKKILLSPVGIHLDLIFYDPTSDGLSDFKVSLILADGTVLELEGGGGGGWTQGDKKAKFSYYARFDIPIPREDIKTILICGTAYDLV